MQITWILISIEEELHYLGRAAANWLQWRLLSDSEALLNPWKLGGASSHPAIMVEYYQILGVRRDASADDIKKAWVDQILLSSNKWLFLISQQMQIIIIIMSLFYFVNYY